MMSNKQNLTEGYTKEEVKEIVVMVRLELYNRGFKCGAQAIKEKMEDYDITPVPSKSTIGKILSQQGLTYGRTGFYP